MKHPPPTLLRIDKWLWAARFFKSRSLATAAVESGKVRINNTPVKPAHSVHIGDLVTVTTESATFEITVNGLSDQRGSAPVAQALYAETPQSSAKRQNDAQQKKFFREPAAQRKGRPTKRERRDLDKFQH